MIPSFFVLLIPLILSNVLHMLIVKRNLAAWMSRPISVPLFGRNKTWRGFVLVPLLNAGISVPFGLWCMKIPFLESLRIGLLLGLAYMAFELPNSYFKRRMGIAPGENSKKFPFLFNLLDKTDSSLGVSLMGMYIFSLTIPQSLLLFVISVSTHAIFSWLLVFLRVKKSF